jgi:hypothetical protein
MSEHDMPAAMRAAYGRIAEAIQREAPLLGPTKEDDPEVGAMMLGGFVLLLEWTDLGTPAAPPSVVPLEARVLPRQRGTGFGLTDDEEFSRLPSAPPQGRGRGGR